LCGEGGLVGRPTGYLENTKITSMSGDCKQQPIIFHSKELTPTKIALLQLYGVSVEVPEFVCYELSDTREEDDT